MMRPPIGSRVTLPSEETPPPRPPKPSQAGETLVHFVTRIEQRDKAVQALWEACGPTAASGMTTRGKCRIFKRGVPTLQGCTHQI